MPFQQLIETVKQRANILGLNNRNVHFINAENDRALYPLVDNKRLTKEHLARYDIPTPQLLHTIQYHRHISQFKKIIQQEKTFAIKPAQGSGGGGILIIVGKTRNGYRKSSGKVVTTEELAFHMHNILNGLYSLGGRDDEVIVESLINATPIIQDLPLSGVPDIRILMYRGIPTMAMLRLPTYESDGKANLHIGGVGVGINIPTGLTTHAVHRNRAIEYHPEFDVPMLGHKIPFWDEILEMSVNIFEAIPLHYMGVDIVIDKDRGPLVLEANARPGISIQLANGEGLLPRLRIIQEKGGDILPKDERLAVARQLYGMTHPGSLTAPSNHPRRSPTL